MTDKVQMFSLGLQYVSEQKTAIKCRRAKNPHFSNKSYKQNVQYEVQGDADCNKQQFLNVIMMAAKTSKCSETASNHVKNHRPEEIL